jgi:phosphonate transport system substrate-binding protein
MRSLGPFGGGRPADSGRGRARNWILGLLGVFVLASTPGNAEVFSLGVVPQYEARKMFTIWRPIVEELEKRTGDHFNLVIGLTVPAFERELEKGTYDFVYANPYHIMRVFPKQHYMPLVRDKAPLRGILVVRKDSPIVGIKELGGKSLAVPSPDALGASLLLRADLERLYGVRMTMVNAKTHSSVYLSVVNGLTDAGGGVQKTFDEQDQRVRDALRVIFTTREMPPHPVAAHPRVSKASRERMRCALLELASTPGGKALLDLVPMKEPVATSIEEYLVMRKWGLEKYWIEEEM